MKPFKKSLILLLSAAVVAFCGLCVAACGNQTSNDAAGSSSATQSESEQATGKTLVVYYSATGNTAGVARMVVDMTGADSFSIDPAQAYTREDLDYNDANSRVSREHDDPALRDVALVQDTPVDWDTYDTVLIGYPIWWGEAAWPVDTFVKANDFTGKSVIPFCTSASSDMGNSAQQLEQMANGGEWLGGMRFTSNADEDEVRQWIDDLGLESQNLQ